MKYLYIRYGQFVSDEYKNGSSCLACIGMKLMIFTELSIVYMHHSIVSIVDQLSESKKGSDFLCRGEILA